MRKSKKFISLGLALMLSAGLLTGCGSKSTQTVKSSNGQVYSTLYEYDVAPEPKEFAPGSHVFTVLAEEVELGVDCSLNYVVPEGYEVISTSTSDRYGSLKYYYVTYRNTEEVIVDPVYDENMETYDYSQFGTVIEKEDSYKLTK